MNLKSRIERLEQNQPEKTEIKEVSIEETERWIQKVLSDDYEPLEPANRPDPDTPIARWLSLR